MALTEVAVKIAFQGGLETKMSPQSVPTVRLLALENAIFTRAVSLSKRYGYTSLGLAIIGSVVPYALPRGLAARGDEVVLFTEAAPYSYVEGAAQWSEVADGCQSIRQTDRALVKTTSSQTGCDYAACNGVALTAWLDSRGGVWFSLGETGDGRITLPPTQASATGTNARAVRVGDKLALLWAEAALGQVRIIVFDPAAPNTFNAVQYPRVIVDDLIVAVPNFDACYVAEVVGSNEGAAAFTWNATAGVKTSWLTAAGLLGSSGIGWAGPVTNTPTAPLVTGPVIAVDSVLSYRWGVVWATATYVYAIGLSSTPQTSAFVAIIGPASSPVEVAINGIDRVAVGFRIAAASPLLDVWAEDRSATVRNSVVYHREVTATDTVTPLPAVFRGACLASCAWTDTPTSGTARGYVTLLHSVPLFSVYLAIRDDGLEVAQTIPTNAGLPPGHTLPRVMDAEGDRTFEWAAIHRNRVTIVDQFDGFDRSFAEAGPRLVTLDFDAADAFQSAYVGRTLYLAGAATMAYDGVGFVEAQFAYAPDWALGAVLHTAGSGGGLAVGVYTYVFWYEGVLANGEIIRGPVSKPYSVTVSGGSDDRITFGVPTMRIGAWGRSGGLRENCRIAAARSLVGDASVYYRISSLDPSTVGADNGYVANSQSADTVAFVDGMVDSAAATWEPLYTVGGIPSNDPIPTSGVIAVAGGRLFLGDSSDRNALYFSQERADGYAVETTPELRIVVPPGGGDVIGVGDIDGVKIIFKHGAIYGLTGNGPLPNPQAGGEWSTPQIITSDVGCVDQRSIVTTPVGLMFQSAKGIYLIDRGRNVTYVGAPVEAYNALAIVRATLIEDANQVRFLTATTTLLYDYLFGQWSTFTNHGGIDAVNANGLYHYLRTDGRVFRQAATYADDNLQIPMVIETAWVRLGEARQGLQRIYHAETLGTWISAHRLFVQYQTDYRDGWSDPLPAAGFDATTMGGDDYNEGNYSEGDFGGDPPDPYQFKNHVGRKCQSIRFRFTFVEAAGAFGACAELTELLLTGGVKNSVNKLPAARMG